MYTNCSTIDEHKLKLQKFNFTIKLSFMIHVQFDIKYKDNVYMYKEGFYLYYYTLGEGKPLYLFATPWLWW